MQIADFHCDLLSYLAGGENRTPYDGAARASIPQLQQGGVKLQTMAIFTKTEEGSEVSGAKQASLYFDLEKYPEFASINTVMAIENGSSFCGEDEALEVGLKRLEEWWKKGKKIAYISLTWNGENRFGGGNGSEVGLKEDGKQVLKWMAGKNIAIDLSHTCDRLAEGILEETKCPVVASHSNFRSVAKQMRNLPDTLAKEIGKRGGLIGLNFVRIFLGKDGKEAFLQQIEYADKLGLLDHLCFGADFFADHSVPPELDYMVPFFNQGYEDATCYPRLIQFLSNYLPPQTLANLAYHNLAKFLELK
jgi:microsomal dipeptidase-like Zn-dependent dipeptidase